MLACLSGPGSKPPAVPQRDRGLLQSFWGRRRGTEVEKQEEETKRVALSAASTPAGRPSPTATLTGNGLDAANHDLLSLESPQIQILIKPPTERELIETEIIKSLILSYFNIVKKNIQDSVPKAVMCFLVNHVKKDMQSELVKTLYKEQLFPTLLKEADDIAEKRMSCLELLDIMQRALDIVNQVRDFNSAVA